MSNIKDQKPLDKNGREHGEWISYWNNGTLDYRGNYVHGRAHGFWEGYYHDNTLRHRGYLNMGRMVGYWYWYNVKKYYLWLI